MHASAVEMDPRKISSSLNADASNGNILFSTNSLKSDALDSEKFALKDEKDPYHDNQEIYPNQKVGGHKQMLSLHFTPSHIISELIGFYFIIITIRLFICYLSYNNCQPKKLI